MCLYTVGRAKHAGRLIVSHLYLSRTCMCMLVQVRAHTHINTVLVRRLLSLNNGAFFTIGDIFPFNTVNAAMPQIADYCSLTDTKKTKQKNVMTCWLEQHQCAFDFWLQLWVWAESGWLLPTETGIAVFADGTISSCNTQLHQYVTSLIALCHEPIGWIHSTLISSPK